ncbi:Beta-xylosidase [Lacrimispora sphenoides]|jgi:beta-xylosidase|uniref:glycoside hydrolase family 43 protein n=1 Tax=Lacrimispora sphenoides TaxID=29370 RepID=UPI0008B31965|nr:glycoside hydrolase 43 family protein [Lacrimispora sphenoides]SEU25341.1 Beta-xylosidase [Lacrimispora sphenoides]
MQKYGETIEDKRETHIWWTDIPDPDVIRVDDTYYMTSTTMHFTPGCPIMRSKDLVHWEIVSYVYDILENSDEMTLKNGKHDYGRGSWASCLRYANHTFYVAFTAYNSNKTYIFQTKNIESNKWDRYTLEGIYHDMSLLFDEDGKVYMVFGGGTIRVIELTTDAKAIKPKGMDKVIILKADVGGEGGLPAEGSHLYKRNGMYYIFLIAWPSAPRSTGRRIQICYRSDRIDGEYEGKVIFENDMGFHNKGVAQGGIFDTGSGEWYSLMFQDHGSVGRIPVLVPFIWEEGWPVFEAYGKLPNINTVNSENFNCLNIVKSDDFNHQTSLSLQWQWNHNCDDRYWSLSERPGWLKLTNGTLCHNISDARNTLTQRTFGPICSGKVLIDTSNMMNGDFAGLSAFQDQYGYVGVMMADDGAKVIMAMAKPEPFEPANTRYEPGKPELIVESIPLNQREIYLRIDFDLRDMADTADFYYSLDGSRWSEIGRQLNMSYRLTHFVGYRFALFSYATKETGGFASFDYFKVS